MPIWDKGLERNFEDGPDIYRGAVPDKICHMANFDPNSSTMVLK